MTNDGPKVASGLDVLIREGFRSLNGQRVGAICNPTSVDHRMRHLADHLHHARGATLVALFGPEHGIRADVQDMIGVTSSIDARTGARVHSLYGSDIASLTPSAQQLDGLDTLLFDVQDVGSRYYTFAATMLYAMRSAASSGLRFVVLDRPNPIGGKAVEGPTILPGYESFVGAHPVPIRHGMTVGELAGLYRAELDLDLELEVVSCQGWNRSMYWAETGLSWVSPSPNMPTPETALVYPGGCLIEGTNLSEGRGTTRPFELWGAPWLDPFALAEAARGVAGTHVRPCSFRPMFHKHAGQLCQGAQPHVARPQEFPAIWFYALMIAAAKAQAPERFAWRTEPYEFVCEPIAIDLLYGSSRERQILESAELLASSDNRGLETFPHWAVESAEFLGRREPFLLYS
jgi:uncharacterized protein YbbC (DUF1343 family)